MPETLLLVHLKELNHRPIYRTAIIRAILAAFPIKYFSDYFQIPKELLKRMLLKRK